MKLSPEMGAKLRELTRPPGLPSIWMPEREDTPGTRASAKQEAFLWLPQLEALYGGAAGGGKSDALLMAALQYVDVPGYSALLLRRTMPMLEQADGLIPRSHSWLAGTAAKWNGNKYTWTFPSGATLGFGYLDRFEHVYRYQGAAFQFIGFDELTQFTRRMYIYMMSRLRRLSGMSVPIRMRGATNPGNIGGPWVKKRFIDRSADDDIPTEILKTLDIEPHLLRRIFIPARLDDNTAIDQGMYRLALAQLDPAERAQLLEGDWDAREPGDWMIPEKFWVDAAVDYYHELIREYGDVPDPAASVKGRGVAIAIDWGEHTQSYTIWPMENGNIYIPPSEGVFAHTDPTHVTPDIIFNATKFGQPITDARYDAAGVQSMRTFINTARAMEGVGLERLYSTKVAFSKYKRLTINYLRMLLQRTAEGEITYTIAIHPDNTELLRQLKFWRRKDEESDEAVKEDDHGPDALVAGLAPIAEANQAKMAEFIRIAYQGKVNEEALAA